MLQCAQTFAVAPAQSGSRMPQPQSQPSPAAYESRRCSATGCLRAECSVAASCSVSIMPPRRRCPCRRACELPVTGNVPHAPTRLSQARRCSPDPGFRSRSRSRCPRRERQVADATVRSRAGSRIADVVLPSSHCSSQLEPSPQPVATPGCRGRPWSSRCRPCAAARRSCRRTAHHGVEARRSARPLMRTSAGLRRIEL